MSAKVEGMKDLTKADKDKVANWLDANVWDGDELSRVDNSGNHFTRLTPMNLYELVVDCFEALKDTGNEN